MEPSPSVQICQLVNHDVLAPAIVFFAVWAFAALNEVARMLEEPFMNDDNGPIESCGPYTKWQTSK
jgi:hypothetical protein